jgi:hypothetical protein
MNHAQQPKNPAIKLWHDMDEDAEKEFDKIHCTCEPVYTGMSRKIHTLDCGTRPAWREVFVNVYHNFREEYSWELCQRCGLKDRADVHSSDQKLDCEFSQIAEFAQDRIILDGNNARLTSIGNFGSHLYVGFTTADGRTGSIDMAYVRGINFH